MRFKKGRDSLGDEIDDEERPFLNETNEDKEVPLWDSFQDPPPKNLSGSLASAQRFRFIIKCIKVFIYLLVFTVVLLSSIISKNLYLLVAAHIRSGTTVKYCDIQRPSQNLVAFIPEEQNIAWVWTLIIAFSAPEIFTFVRAVRICYFKIIRIPTIMETCLVGLMETLHVIGLSIFTFGVLPELYSSRGLMLTNCVCFVPALINLVPETKKKIKFMFILLMGIAAAFVQFTGFLIWPAVDPKNPRLWMIIPACILISFRWWENFVSPFSVLPPLRYLAHLRGKLTKSRYQMYLYISVWKICVFMFTSIIIDMSLNNRSFTVYFEKFADGWKQHNIIVKKNQVKFTDRPDDSTETHFVESQQMSHIGILLMLIFSSHFSYIFSKFACKIKIQEFSCSLPISIAVPASLVALIFACILREENTCYFHGYLPDYMAFKGPSLYSIWSYILNEYIWMWVVWWLSQSWITRHIWHPKNDKNVSTEKLFIVPWYSSLVVDQCILLNRRRLDDEDFVLHLDSALEEEISMEPDLNETADILPTDKIPQVLICATMWHENPEEMIEFLKSIIRLDEDQCARRMARKYFPKKGNNDFNQDYYELETHIYFDDAFILDPKFVADAENPPINKYVRDFLDSIDEAASKVFETNVQIEPPTKVKTPYGARLIWTLPGRTKMIAHLKNKDKIRHKKRWSQVMYMYYLLGYRIMEMDISPQRKTVIAKNTFILALDGDIDFQPQAVQLLIARMKAVPDLGAACGRIHPIGKGAMVWYQVFEYAIGHWLQKATEHVIGCVLCSPGCFSLFRAQALMDYSVMKKYTTLSKEARHHVQYDQGEDRWLCTLILKQKYRVEYAAASDAYTHAPEGFYEFYNQRRRWIPSTIANILDLLSDAKSIVKNNNSISMLYIYYQIMLMVGTILGPGTIFLMMVGSIVAVFSIDIWTSFLWNFVPILIFMGMCYFCKQKYQLFAAVVISAFYSLVMMAVLIGIVIQMIDDGILSPPSLFFLTVVIQVIITGLMHPQEVMALFYGIVYYITIPSMYMLLLIYSLFNLNDVSWGTRESAPLVQSNDPNIPKMAGWQEDPALDNCQQEVLSVPEKSFWKNLIKKYLKPLEITPQEDRDGKQALKELRDLVVFAFVMINSLFVLVVFLMQIKKEYLHIPWPMQVKYEIFYNEDDEEILIKKIYLELDPIGLVFIVFFGLILCLQFIAMFIHRFGTLSQILASTDLNWYCNVKGNDDNAEQRGDAITLAKYFQRPKKQFDDEDESDDEERPAARRTTIHKLIEQREYKKDWNNLEVNFKRRYNADGKLKLGNISVSRKTIQMLETHRSTVIAERRRTVQMMNNQNNKSHEPPSNDDNNTYDNPGFDAEEFEMTDRNPMNVSNV